MTERALAAGRSRLAVTAINEPVSCGGVRVRGDVWSATGQMVCIAAERTVEVDELAQCARDDEAAAELRKGLTFQRGDGQV